MQRRVFAYGTLEIPQVMETLVGRRPAARPATLDGYARFRVRGQPYPGIVAQAGARVQGMLYEALEDADLALLDHFEGELYERRSVCVRSGGGDGVAAEAWIVPPRRRRRLSAEPWDRASFEAGHLEDFLTRCRRLRRAWCGADRS